MMYDYDGTASGVARDGTTCVFRHQEVGASEKPGNVSLLVTPDLTRRAQLKDPAAPRAATYPELT